MKKLIILVVLILTGCNSVGYRDSVATPFGDVRMDTRSIDGNTLGNIKIGGFDFDI